MLRDARSRDRETKSEGENTNPSNHTTTTNNNNSTNSHHPQTEKTLDGDDFNVINREEADDVDEVEEEEEADSEEEQHSFYRPGLAGLLGGRMMQRSSRSAPGKFDHLHPFTQVLSVSNVDDCVELEAEAFPENERCSREKFVYRLSTCPELSLGLFSRPTLSELESNRSITPKHRLIAHISATRTPSRHVTDASMSFPADWKRRRSSLPQAGETGEEQLGHQEQGGTVALHSLAVAKEHQRKGLGTILLKAYIERIKSAKIAERISILAHDHLIKFYKEFGFVDEGLSEVRFGGGKWNNMVLEFSEQVED